MALRRISLRLRPGFALPQKPGKVATEEEPRRHQVTEVPP